MKHALLLLSLIIAGSAQAQCPFTPTITPDPAVICPSSTLSLGTQAYESYQWYENGQAITDQTAQVLEVDNASVGHSFTVECTLDGCTAMSAPVVLEGLSFAPPTMVLAGAWPITVFQGASWFCMGADVFLILQPPYDTNIQWFKNGTQMPGEHNDTLEVTLDGTYTARGAPAQCPAYVRQVATSEAFHFQSPEMPVITAVGDQLCAGGGGMPWQYHWYLNGESIGNGPCITPTVPGIYTVTGPGSKNVCGTAPSAPYEVITIGMAEHNAAVALAVRPNPANTECTIASSLPLNGPWRLMDAAGREVYNGRFNNCTTCALDLSAVEAGNYLLLVADRSVRIAVVR